MKLLALGFLILASCAQSPDKVGPYTGFAPVLSGPASKASATTGYQIGGSNYVIFDQGAVAATHNPNLTDPSQYVLLNYHNNKSLVQSQIQQMCAHGQKKISLTFWWRPFPDEWNIDCNAPPSIAVNSYAFTCNGKVADQHMQNIRNVVAAVASTGCFDELDFRFAPMAQSNPSQSDTVNVSSFANQWSEARYQENKAIIFTIRNEIETRLASSPMQRLYDLGAEQAGIAECSGITTCYNMQYMQRLWTEYATAFGTNDSYGFSFAPYQHRVLNQLAMFAASGVEPAMFAFDVYKDNYTGDASWFDMAIDDLVASNIHKPVLIQETYYNNPVFNDLIVDKLKSAGLQLRSIMQYPIDELAVTELLPFSVDFPVNYDVRILGEK